MLWNANIIVITSKLRCVSNSIIEYNTAAIKTEKLMHWPITASHNHDNNSAKYPVPETVTEDDMKNEQTHYHNRKI